MKVFEHIMLRYLKSSMAGLLDPHQYAYQTNRSADDAVALGLHYVMKHLQTTEYLCEDSFRGL